MQRVLKLVKDARLIVAVPAEQNGNVLSQSPFNNEHCIKKHCSAPHAPAVPSNNASLWMTAWRLDLLPTVANRIHDCRVPSCPIMLMSVQTHCPDSDNPEHIRAPVTPGSPPYGVPSWQHRPAAGPEP